MNLCIPAATIEAVSGSFTRTWQRTKRQPTPGERTALHENLARLTLGVTAVIDTTLSAGSSPACAAGTSSPSITPSGQPIDVRVNGKTKYRAHPHAHTHGAALEIDELVTLPTGTL